MLAQRLFDQDQMVADAWNFGPDSDSEQSVEFVVKTFARLWRGKVDWVTDNTDQPHEAGLLKLDSSRARDVLGWRPRFDLESSLAMTVNWYREAQAQKSMREITENQIAAFEQIDISARN